jgi:hypothetical protein
MHSAAHELHADSWNVASRCLEDLTSTTRYVTWSLHTKSSTAMTAMLRRVRRIPIDDCILPAPLPVNSRHKLSPRASTLLLTGLCGGRLQT